ncbi:LysR substrate-binding domain-containing protein [Salinisphaera hydrothermalis]|uniref:LysR substrate-binding domain-containing protein n=2 Tax=Salinisphaera hydrothermalis TaxID=563188 RepID=UPI00333F1460
MTRYHADFPAVGLRLSPGSTADIGAQLLEGTLDGAFIAGPVPHSRWYTVDAFHGSLVLATDKPLQALPSADELFELLFRAFAPGCHYRHRVESLFDHLGLYGGRIFAFGSNEGILGCVAAAMGYVLLPKTVVEAQRSGFAVYFFDLPSDVGHVVTRFAAMCRAGWSPALVAFERSVRCAGFESALPAASA